jgi:hypothetical protein
MQDARGPQAGQRLLGGLLLHRNLRCPTRGLGRIAENFRLALGAGQRRQSHFVEFDKRYEK